MMKSLNGKNFKKVEILAPAGSYDVLTAVIHAGADAVYLGGASFGARAFAGNFNQEELLRALDFAHLRDKKIYMTVNTLLKERERKERLTDYILPFYRAGLDAVIVQDFGVFETLHAAFPDLPIHASTQMTVTGAKGTGLLQKMGAARVVTARELNLSELKEIHETCDIEIESFVHGALCYCYSGQCLLSSMNGTRSGNRGRCAQVCRLAYEAADENGRVINDAKSSYALSPKDMCTLTLLPDIIEAGVYSLKIEGRMKNVTYAAGVTAMYRKYVDLYMEKGRAGYAVEPSDIEALMDLYNRGAFTGGYYNQSKGREMMSLARPNHMGTAALQVVENISGRVTFQALREIHPQDVFEIDREHSFSSGGVYHAGQRFQVNLPKKHRLPKGRIVYRTRNQALVRQVQEKFVDGQGSLIPLKMHFTAEQNQPIRLRLCASAKRYGAVETEVFGVPAQPAVKQPASREKTAAQLAKLGGTPFCAAQVTVDLDGAVFIPVAQLNELRRMGVQSLTAQILKKCRRDDAVLCPPVKEDTACSLSGGAVTKPAKTVLVSTLAQAQGAFEMDDIHSVYLDFLLLDAPLDERLSEICRHSGKEAAAVLPHVLRGKNTALCKTLVENALVSGIDTFLVRNLEELGLLSEYRRHAAIKIIFDAGMYCWNSAAAKQLKEMAETAGLTLLRLTMPYELNSTELAQIDTRGIPTELIVYGHIPLMLSEQCVKRTYGRCDRKNTVFMLKEPKNGTYPVKSICRYCYSVLYSQKPLDLRSWFGQRDCKVAVLPDYIRYELTEGLTDGLSICSSDAPKDKMTPGYSGHFITGVE